jgi:hypothetical protein
MSWKLLVSAGLWIVLASPAFAAPTLTVADGGLVGGNMQWLISVTPDVATFVPNSSLAVELDFTFHGTITSFLLDNTFWNKTPVNNVGNNPFTGTVTGTQVDNAPANDTLFIAAGSDLYATATSHLLGTLVTPGLGGLLEWGDHQVLSGANAYTLGRIAQNDVNTNGITGYILITDGDGFCIQPGDFNCNGAVENADLTLLLNSWTKAVPPIPDGWIGTPQPTGPAIDNDELTALLTHWGQHTPGAGSAVPEPTSMALALALVGLAGCGFVVRHRRAGLPISRNAARVARPRG